MNEIDQMGRSNRLQPIFIGGVAGPNGGTNTGPITIIGQIPQSKVTYDTTEGTGSGISPSGSLVHNLNRIRGGWAMGDGFLKARHLSSEIIFTALKDVPTSYVGQKNKVVRVNSAENGLEFAIVSGGGGAGATVFTSLTDVPNSYTGGALKVVRVKSDQTGLEFAIASGGGSSGHIILASGTTMPTEPKLNFYGNGVIVTDNPANTRTDIYINNQWNGWHIEIVMDGSIPPNPILSSGGDDFVYAYVPD